MPLKIARRGSLRGALRLSDAGGTCARGGGARGAGAGVLAADLCPLATQHLDLDLAGRRTRFARRLAPRFAVTRIFARRWAALGAVALAPDATDSGAAERRAAGAVAAVRSLSAMTWAPDSAVSNTRTSSMAPAKYSPQTPLPPMDSGPEVNRRERDVAAGDEHAVA